MNHKTNKKRTFEVIISVDETKLRSQREEIDDSFSLKDAIQNEFGWLHESGIYLEEIQNQINSSKKNS